VIYWCAPSLLAVATFAIGVLSDLVMSGESEVWRAALDALVAIGGDDARKALQESDHAG